MIEIRPSRYLLKKKKIPETSAFISIRLHMVLPPTHCPINFVEQVKSDTLLPKKYSHFAFKTSFILFYFVFFCFLVFFYEYLGHVSRKDGDNLEKLIVTGKVEGTSPRRRIPTDLADQI